jgi:hypothetical protein
MSEETGEIFKSNENLFEMFPFLRAYPFDDYVITLEKGNSLLDELDIDPIRISAGGYVKPEFVNFYYDGEVNRITLSFYTYDLSYMLDQAKKIKKFDDIRKTVDFALKSDSLLTKIDSIKRGDTFLKKIGSSLKSVGAFGKILDEMLILAELEIEKPLLKEIKGMKLTIDEHLFSEEEFKIIKSFYNLHLHHIKILLGIIISIKIY